MRFRALEEAGGCANLGAMPMRSQARANDEDGNLFEASLRGDFAALPNRVRRTFLRPCAGAKNAED